MQKQLQESVCFRLNRRAEDAGGADERITLGDILLVLILFVDMYALDAAARQLAVYFIIPFGWWK